MALVVIQAGHTFRRSGATGTNGLDGDPTEQEFAWAAANRSADLLRAAGHQARVITADVSSGAYQGDAFCAIHCDGSTSRSARGASVGYRNDQGKRLASAWKQAYYNAGWRGFRGDNYTAALAGYYGVRNAVNQGNRHAFIAEAGFLTNPDDERLLSGAAGSDRFARALTQAVVSVFGGTAGSPSPTGDWFDMADENDLKAALREVLNEGTGPGQRAWKGTSAATLATVQKNYNMLRSVMGRAPLTKADVQDAVNNVLVVHEAVEDSALRDTIASELAEALGADDEPA